MEFNSCIVFSWFCDSLFSKAFYRFLWGFMEFAKVFLLENPWFDGCLKQPAL